jgi:hypothetical protein
MDGMSDPAKIRQAAAGRMKMALIMAIAAVAMASLYFWKYASVDLWISGLWVAASIFNLFVYREHKKKLKAIR